MLWFKKKKNGDAIVACVAQSLRDITVDEYNEERHRHRQILEAFHGPAAQYHILCNACKSPITLTEHYDELSDPARQQAICNSKKCARTWYVLA